MYVCMYVKHVLWWEWTMCSKLGNQQLSMNTIESVDNTVEKLLWSRKWKEECSLWPLITLSLTLETTIFTTHKCQWDERIDNPLRRSKFDGKLEVCPFIGMHILPMGWLSVFNWTHGIDLFWGGGRNSLST